jgi:hypothetical protein
MRQTLLAYENLQQYTDQTLRTAVDVPTEVYYVGLRHSKCTCAPGDGQLSRNI